MAKYEHRKLDMSPEDALELAFRASADKEFKHKTLTLDGKPYELSLLYHASKCLGLNATNMSVDGKTIPIPKDIIALREAEWTMFMRNEGKAFLKTLRRNRPQATMLKATKVTSMPPKKQLTGAMEKLYGLPGLTGTKEQVSNEIALQRTELMRARKGLRTNDTSRHMVFTGNPGTGKTTVARIIGEIYREMGLLKKGHFVEIGGRDLIAEYIGQTTNKVREVVMEALDGILFIDEAYAMIPGDSFRDFGPEALAALIKFMEDYRDRLIVIMAGYGDEMDELLNKNPGLKSRMKTRIHFPDYAPDELATIFELQCEEQQYTLTHDARERAKSLFTSMYNNRDKDFGNGRSVRNAFERCIVKQARRLSDKRSPSKRELQTLYANDIPALDELDW